MAGELRLPWSDVVRVSRYCGDDQAVARLEPGRDVLLDIPRRWGESLPKGLLLDDLLSQDVRESLDNEAIAALAAWRQKRDGQLTLAGTCLPEIWEHELLAEVFLTETRIVSGLRHALDGSAIRRVVVDGFDHAGAECITETLRPAGIDVDASAYAPPPTYPGILAAPWRIPLPIRIAKALMRAVGVPGCERGFVYMLPYWHLTPLLRSFTNSSGWHPVLDPWRLPRVEVSTLVRAAARGGWVACPGLRPRHRSRLCVSHAIAEARKEPTPSDPLKALLDLRALTMVEQRAGETLAEVESLRQSFASRNIRVAVLPYDSPPDARAVITAARETNVATLVVQHGLQNEPNESDKTLANTVAVWSEADARQLEGRAAGTITPTGNPGIKDPDLLLRPKRQPLSNSTLVLVEYASRLSTRVDQRISIGHVSTALHGLAQARPGARVIVRPHPAEHEAEIFEGLISAHPEIDVRVDATTPISTLISASDLCISAVSTAALEAAAAGVPVVHLNVTGRPARPPFDGSSGLPVATSVEELAALVPAVLASPEVPGRPAMLEALGVRIDARARVIELIRQSAAADPIARPDNP